MIFVIRGSLKAKYKIIVKACILIQNPNEPSRACKCLKTSPMPPVLLDRIISSPSNSVQLIYPILKLLLPPFQNTCPFLRNCGNQGQANLTQKFLFYPCPLFSPFYIYLSHLIITLNTKIN